MPGNPNLNNSMSYIYMCTGIYYWEIEVAKFHEITMSSFFRKIYVMNMNKRYVYSEFYERSEVHRFQYCCMLFLLHYFYDKYDIINAK